VAAAEPKASSQPIAPLGSQLTTNELDAIRQQLRECWLVPSGARDAKDLRPEFRVYMNQDGTVRSATQLNPERNSEPFFQAAAESAMRALRNPRCQPLKLPPQKYDAWQTFTITFDPKDLS
ncbi:MAG TPA: energy transducer TonB, partial [Stellaceae bacterium]